MRKWSFAIAVLCLVMVIIGLSSSLAESQEQQIPNALDENAFIDVYAKPNKITSGTSTSVVVITDRDFDKIVLMNESSRITDTRTAPVNVNGTQKEWILSTQKISGNYGRTFTVRAYTGDTYVEETVKILFIKSSDTAQTTGSGTSIPLYTDNQEDSGCSCRQSREVYD